MEIIAQNYTQKHTAHGANIVLSYLLLAGSTIEGDCDGASFCRGVQSSVQYSVCLSASMGRIYRVESILGVSIMWVVTIVQINRECRL